MYKTVSEFCIEYMTKTFRLSYGAQSIFILCLPINHISFFTTLTYVVRHGIVIIHLYSP